MSPVSDVTWPSRLLLEAQYTLRASLSRTDVVNQCLEFGRSTDTQISVHGALRPLKLYGLLRTGEAGTG